MELGGFFVYNNLHLLGTSHGPVFKLNILQIFSLALRTLQGTCYYTPLPCFHFKGAGTKVEHGI